MLFDWTYIIGLVVAAISAIFYLFKQTILPAILQDRQDKREFDQKMKELEWESNKQKSDTEISQVQLDHAQALTLCREQLKYHQESNEKFIKVVLDLNQEISKMSKAYENSAKNLQNNILQLTGIIAELKDKFND